MIYLPALRIAGISAQSYSVPSFFLSMSQEMHLAGSSPCRQLPVVWVSRTIPFGSACPSKENSLCILMPCTLHKWDLIPEYVLVTRPHSRHLKPPSPTFSEYSGSNGTRPLYVLHLWKCLHNENAIRFPGYRHHGIRLGFQAKKSFRWKDGDIVARCW